MPKRRALIGIAAVVLVVIVWALLVPGTDWLARHDVGPARVSLLPAARDAARGRLLTLGAGLLAAGALLFTARNFALSREGQVTDRYTKAIEQLGHEKLDVRIGGIYALERIARDSAKDHPTVMEVLTAFIREHSREPWPPPHPEQERLPRPDVQAAVTVAGRRDAKRDILPIDLAGADLAGADLDGAIWPEAVRVPDGWMVDDSETLLSGRLKRAGQLSEVTAHYLWQLAGRPAGTALSRDMTPAHYL